MGHPPPQVESDDRNRPYPFCLAETLSGPPAGLGTVGDWLLEWKWDGIRGQMVRRGDALHIWSRGEELITAQFPELGQLATGLPDGTVLDGEILAWHEAPLGFSVLQTRIARKQVSARIMREAPVVFMAYDLLEDQGRDVRPLPLEQRRERLVELVRGQAAGGSSGPKLLLSPVLRASDWDGAARLRDEARRNLVEGLMIKRCDAPYGTGRGGGAWWKWKLDPLSVDAVLVYAYSGHGRRAGLFSDYTFALRDGDQLVPFAKAYSGLTEDEIKQVDAFVRRNTLQRRGPARIVKAELVFEIGFTAVAPSKRHRAGIGVRFPRILRWRHDKSPADADSVDELRRLAEMQSIGPVQSRPPQQMMLWGEQGVGSL